jgi:hypothetical protein
MRFLPCADEARTKDGKPVPVLITLEMTFTLR